MAQRPAAAKERPRYRYQYAAKFVCTANIPGTSQTTGSVLPGVYQTAVNIHTPNDGKVRYRVKIAVAEPSGFVEDGLGPDCATRWDCERVRIAFGPFIHGFEGFLVVEASHSLDVIAVYTAGPTGGQVASIDVAPVRERQLG